MVQHNTLLTKNKHNNLVRKMKMEKSKNNEPPFIEKKWWNLSKGPYTFVLKFANHIPKHWSKSSTYVTQNFNEEQRSN